MNDPHAFETGLLHRVKLSEAEFDRLRCEAREYRDKFLAHLDELEKMHPPLLDQLKVSAAYYYDYLLQHENDGATFVDAPPSAEAFYGTRKAEGDLYYDRIETRHA